MLTVQHVPCDISQIVQPETTNKTTGQIIEMVEFAVYCENLYVLTK